MKKNNYYEILISDRFMQWLYKTQPCYMSYDFTGYLMQIDAKNQIYCALSWDGTVIIYSIDPNNLELNKRKLKKYTKKLIKQGVIYKGIQPFNELKQIPIDYNHVIIIHDFLFSGVMNA